MKWPWTAKSYQAASAAEKRARMLKMRPEGCICVMFTDTGGYRIADLTCPVHGVNGTHPGDGYWEDDERDTR